MADNATPAIDPATGVFTSGRFAGYTPEDVARYTETLENSIRGGNPPPAAPKPAAAPATPPAQTPEERLAAANNDRVAPMSVALVQRMLQDDEEAFRATVSDYDKYSERIEAIKKTLTPNVLMQRGLHRQIYINVKGQDPEFQHTILGTTPPPAPEVPPAAEVPPPAATVQVAAHSRQAPAPKAVPPALPPTPGARSAGAPASQERTPKLVADDKMRRFCRATGQDVNTYLLRLEDQGKTQADLDSLGATDKTRRSVYDRTVAPRR